jgi:succinate dehydrogenase / fumarate reductase cytochrome b subunit
VGLAFSFLARIPVPCIAGAPEGEPRSAAESPPAAPHLGSERPGPPIPKAPRMLSWFTRTANSSIGKKALMSLTGLLLIGFLVAHLAGNLTFYADSDGTAFNDYAHLLESNPLLPVAELGLIVLFLGHIVMGIRVTAENRQAREQRYAVKAVHGGRTAGSRTMILTGITILVFLVVHLLHFRLVKTHDSNLAEMVRVELSKPLGAGVYVVGLVALGIHLSHAFKSALQTLGLHHARYTPLLEKVGVGLAALLTLGFLSFPIYVFFFGGNA